jgi:DMSO/TMAO reductase YedYZ molybdopterin-dependent catalytic subunit
MSRLQLSRRGLLTGAAASSGLMLSGCDAMDGIAQRESSVRRAFEGIGNSLSYRVQRLLSGRNALAQEFTQADIRQPMRPNGVIAPQNSDYRRLLSGDFADYRLTVSGLVERPLSLTREQLTAMPARTQITRHDCVEGWSCIAKWTGVPLGLILDQAVVKPSARFVVFHCLDAIEQSLAGDIKYYESIDMIDAHHPQTILAYGLNDRAMPVENGAPLRLRVERQLGYKMAKFVHGIEVVDDLRSFGLGKGGYWEDRGYEWYAGI